MLLIIRKKATPEEVQKTKLTVLNIATNLNRIGNWAADGFCGRERRIRMFLKQTGDYLVTVDTNGFQEPLRRAFSKFAEEFQELRAAAGGTPEDEKRWAEKMMTWGNILTHRASLIP